MDRPLAHENRRSGHLHPVEQQSPPACRRRPRHSALASRISRRTRSSSSLQSVQAGFYSGGRIGTASAWADAAPFDAEKRRQSITACCRLQLPPPALGFRHRLRWEEDGQAGPFPATSSACLCLLRKESSLFQSIRSCCATSALGAVNP